MVVNVSEKVTGALQSVLEAAERAKDNVTQTSIYTGVTPGGIRAQYSEGTSAKPSTNALPIIYAEKYVGLSRVDGGPQWDLGAAHFQLEKRGGDIFAVALGGYAKHTAGTGQIIGIHGRATGNHANAEVWGLWGYVTAWPEDGTRIHTGIACELNVRNMGQDLGWMETGGPGALRGLVVATADSNKPGTIAIAISRTQSSGKGWWTGLLIRNEAICGMDANGNGEAIRVMGAIAAGAPEYGGIRIGRGRLAYGVKMTEAQISGLAIELATAHEIGWYDGVDHNNDARLSFGGSKIVRVKDSLLVSDYLTLGQYGSGKFMTIFERTSDPIPVASTARLYVVNTGSQQELRVRFGNGVVKTLATSV